MIIIFSLFRSNKLISLKLQNIVSIMITFLFIYQSFRVCHRNWLELTRKTEYQIFHQLFQLLEICEYQQHPLVDRKNSNIVGLSLKYNLFMIPNIFSWTIIVKPGLNFLISLKYVKLFELLQVEVLMEFFNQ